MQMSVDELIAHLEDCAAFLRGVGEETWSGRMTAVAAKLRRGQSGAVREIGRWSGGMGSLNDLYLCGYNSHDVEAPREQAVNDELRRRVELILVSADRLKP
jgi:hypothetical protein